LSSLEVVVRDAWRVVREGSALYAPRTTRYGPRTTRMDPFRDALILTGPTGSGKTPLAVELAERLGGEIVSMDSMAVYRGMDIGTAKPTAEERRRVPHHLLDVLDPWESASVAWWLGEAHRCCQEIAARGRRALIVGGTPLYLKALLRGLFPGPPADETLRRRLEREAASAGPEALHGQLARVDPVAAGRLHPNDLRRVVRALEVWELTGRPISSWQLQWSPAEGHPSCLCLTLPRAELYARIDARVMRMFADGLVDEVRALRSLPRPLSREAGQALGYKEVGLHLDGRASLEDTVTRVQARTRQLAKRQLTWFRHLPECRPVTGELTRALWAPTMDKGAGSGAGVVGARPEGQPAP
jgi:tRNA dimethylallyltransferase